MKNPTITIIKSERPKEPILKKKRIFYRFNKLKVIIFNLLFKRGFKYNALSAEESLDLLLKTKKSLIRFGNGESEIIVGLDMGTQEYRKELRKKLIEIWKNYSENSPYLMALTNWNLTADIKELKRRGTFGIWRFMRYLLWKYKIEKSSLPYPETDMFRASEVTLPYEKIELLWKDFQNIIMVHNSNEYFNWFKNKNLDKKVWFVKIPDKNMFDVLNEIKSKILQLINYNDLPATNTVILLAGGPGGKVLCYELINLGYRCYDMGNFFHTFYQLEKLQNEKI
ncbi:GT-D fold domain-containing glycosyltransferase [Thermodesulfovibrio hydrogeniphilus]